VPWGEWFTHRGRVAVGHRCVPLSAPAHPLQRMAGRGPRPSSPLADTGKAGQGEDGLHGEQQHDDQ